MPQVAQRGTQGAGLLSGSFRFIFLREKDGKVLKSQQRSWKLDSLWHLWEMKLLKGTLGSKPIVSGRWSAERVIFLAPKRCRGVVVQTFWGWVHDQLNTPAGDSYAPFDHSSGYSSLVVLSKNSINYECRPFWDVHLIFAVPRASSCWWNPITQRQKLVGQVIGYLNHWDDLSIISIAWRDLRIFTHYFFPGKCSNSFLLIMKSQSISVHPGNLQ